MWNGLPREQLADERPHTLLRRAEAALGLTVILGCDGAQQALKQHTLPVQDVSQLGAAEGGIFRYQEVGKEPIAHHIGHEHRVQPRPGTRRTVGMCDDCRRDWPRPALRRAQAPSGSSR